MDRGEGEDLLLRLGRAAWGLLGVFALLAVTWWLVDQLGQVLVPLALAMFPAAILTPPARWLERHGLGRTGSTAAVTALAAVAVVAVASLLVVQVQSQAGDLVDQAQQGYERLRTQLGDGAFGLPPIDLDAVVQQLRDGMTSDAGTADTEGAAAAEAADGPNVLGAVTSSAMLLAQFFFALVAMFLFVRDGDRITAWVRQLFPAHLRHHVHAVGEDMGATLGGYIRGQATVAAIDAFFIGLGLVVLGVPLALSLTVLVFVASFVPIAGAFLSGAAAALVALAAGGFTEALVVVALVVVVQQLEGNILQPWILGNRVELHPLAVITILTAGGFLYGLPGAILAVPLAASAYRALDHVVAVARSPRPVGPGEHPERRHPDPDPAVHDTVDVRDEPTDAADDEVTVVLDDDAGRDPASAAAVGVERQA